MFRAIAGFLAVAVFCVSSAQTPDIRRDFILLEKDAVGLLAPRLASNAYAQSIKWSSDGAYLMVDRTDVDSAESQMIAAISGKPPAQGFEPLRELVFFAKKGFKTKSVVSFKSPGIQVQTLDWLPSSSKVLMHYSLPRQSEDGTLEGVDDIVAMISASDGKVQTLAKSDQNVGFDLEIAPNAPRFALVRVAYTPPAPGSGEHPSPRIEIQFGSSDGALGPSLKMPVAFSELRWGADGVPYICTRQKSKTRRAIDEAWLRLDRTTGAMSPATEPKPWTAPAGKGVQAVSFDFKFPAPKNVETTIPNIKAVAITAGEAKGENIALASSDAIDGVLAPSGDAVAYIHHGVAMVRPLIHVSKEAYLQALAAARRIEIISNAKQVGLALIMFGGDNDDKLPGQGDDWKDKVDPYLRNQSIMAGFVFSLAGGDFSKIDNPASTEMGYIPGPGGRAVVYADGHVRWVANP